MHCEAEGCYSFTSGLRPCSKSSCHSHRESAYGRATKNERFIIEQESPYLHHIGFLDLLLFFDGSDTNFWDVVADLKICSFLVHYRLLHESTGAFNESHIYRCHYGAYDAVASSSSHLAPLKAFSGFTRDSGTRTMASTEAHNIMLLTTELGEIYH